MTSTTTPIHLTRDEGVADLWWPYGPSVGRYTIKTTSDSLVQMLARDSRGAATPMHIHHEYDETWFVISGEIEVFVGDERFTAGAGDFAFGPRGVPHAWVVTSETCEVLVTCNGPGLDAFFAEVAYPVDGEKPEPQMPDVEHFARRMAAYGIELVGPPPGM
jgi:mannose-6-phosphate isomerase-like protein (cupin superfamily)